MRKIPRQISDRLPAAADLFAEKGLNDSKIEDVAAVTHRVLRHRLILGFEAANADVTADRVVDAVLQAVRVP